MKTYRLALAAAVTLTVLTVGAAPASAGSGTYDLTNGCKISWSNGFSGGTASGNTTERADCASLQTRLAYTPPGGAYTEAQTSYLAQSSVSISRSAIDAFWTDHNGRRTTSGTAYGIRRSI